MSGRRRSVLVAAVLLHMAPLATGLAAQQTPAQPATLVLQSGTAEFTANATLGDFTGTTTRISGEVRSTGGPEAARGWVTVRLDSLSTGNGRRDGHMREALETSTFPEARFDLDSVRPGAPNGATAGVTGHEAGLLARAGEAPGLEARLRGPLLPSPRARPVLLHGRFTVHGVSRPVTALGAIEGAPDGTWTLIALFPVTLSEHAISKGLSRMLGTIKVKPIVGVRLNATFVPR